MAEVAAEADVFYIGILPGQCFDFLQGCIGAAIVDEEDFEGGCNFMQGVIESYG
jgi:hypothetical protein